MNQKSEPVAAIVLAAGKGTRMGSDLHKVLHPSGGKPMLGHVLDNLAALEAAKTIVVVGAGREQIASAYPDLTTAIQEPQLGTAHAVQMARQDLEDFDGLCLVLYGDVPLISAQTMARICDAASGDHPVAILGFRPDDTRTYGRLVTNANGDLERIVEHADANAQERAINLCNSGILAARSPYLFELLAKVGNDNAKGEYYLTDIVQLAHGDGHSIAVVEASPEEVQGVNSLDELVELEAQLSDRALL